VGAFSVPFDSLKGEKQAASPLLHCSHRAGCLIGKENGRDGIPSC
jgi:hypothetical protein